MDFLNKYRRKIVIDPITSCWVWIGAKTGNYGAITYKGKSIGSHKLSFILHKGEVPTGMLVRHSCDNPPCCNPDHLFCGTASQNAQECRDRGRANTPKGEDNGHAKLCKEDVWLIRNDSRNNAVLAVEYGVHPSTISMIRSRTRWKHV